MFRSAAQPTLLITGGAGYIGSTVAYRLRQAGFRLVIIDNLVHGHAWAAGLFGTFCYGDVGDAAFVRSVCATYKPFAALHFAAFIEVGESVDKPEKYFTNNRDKAKIFFDTAQAEGIKHIIYSNTAAVYSEPVDGLPLREESPTCPLNPYGQSKLDAELYLRSLAGVTSVTMRYFNAAGAAPLESGVGEAHIPETHLLPRLILPLLPALEPVRQKLGLTGGFKVYGSDFPTPDGTAIRDYIHVLDLAEALTLALRYLQDGGPTAVFNLGTEAGLSVLEIVAATKRCFPDAPFEPQLIDRRAGDPARLVADASKARQILGWKPAHTIDDMILSAAAWHQTERYAKTILGKAGA